jgi:hypothetical protein
MEKLLKKDHFGIISEFHAIQAIETPSLTVHLNMQLILFKHQSIFENPQRLPPSCGPHDHSIHLSLVFLPMFALIVTHFLEK